MENLISGSLNGLKAVVPFVLNGNMPDEGSKKDQSFDMKLGDLIPPFPSNLQIFDKKMRKIEWWISTISNETFFYFNFFASMRMYLINFLRDFQSKEF